MNLERTTGVILRLRPLTDSSLIVQWLTADFGRLATVAKGARRAKSSFRGQLDLFYSAEFSFARSVRSELHTLRESKTLATHASLRQDLVWLQQACYAAALLEQTTETETPLPVLYEQFSQFLAELPRHPPQPQTIFAFEMKLLSDLGLRPNLAEAALTPGSRQILDKIIKLDWPSIFRLRLSPAQLPEIRQFLHQFLVYHVGKIPKGRASTLTETHAQS
jgi:DNA repair protein RecO (recombination protein O)